jgi:hypothetical protein
MMLIIGSVCFILGFFVGGEVRMWVHNLAKKHADIDQDRSDAAEADYKTYD